MIKIGTDGGHFEKWFLKNPPTLLREASSLVLHVTLKEDNNKTHKKHGPMLSTVTELLEMTQLNRHKFLSLGDHSIGWSRSRRVVTYPNFRPNFIYETSGSVG